MDDLALFEGADQHVPRYAVIGRSDEDPTLYHMNLPWVRADYLRARREAATGRPCYVIPMAAWHHDPLAALQRAERARSAPR
jgi:hypothetical protein